jgi:hypothetical protein
MLGIAGFIGIGVSAPLPAVTTVAPPTPPAPVPAALTIAVIPEAPAIPIGTL